MTVSRAEIEFGRMAVARRLATQDQVREAVTIKERLPQPLHIGAILVKKGYLTERDARDIMAQVDRTNGGSTAPPTNGGVQPSHAGPLPSHAGPPSNGGRPTAAEASSNGRAPAPSAIVVCVSCGARYPAPGVAAPFRCRSCGAWVSPTIAPVAAPPTAPVAALGSRPAPPPSAWAGPPSGPAAPPRPYGGPPSYPAPTNGASDSVLETKGNIEVPAGLGVRPETLKDDPSSHRGKVPAGADATAALPADDPIAAVIEERRGPDGRMERVFGPYDVIGEIARGGMGIVYRAKQRDLKRVVALKVMKEGETASEKQIRRFKRETEAAARLQHPNIVAVHEVGCHKGFHYFTMDLIEGDALDVLVKRGEKMTHERVLNIVMEVARAIHYAHGKGIIHRDLKPANILLDTDGHPKVTDFGLAKQIDQRSMLTKHGAVVGTPFYMPPEQARGEQDVDQRVDVYALGVILYELLTLKLPFTGETTMEVYHKILEEEPLPPRHHDPKVARDVETICLKSMDKDPARRYQTAKDLADDVERYLQGEPIMARPLGPFGKVARWARKNTGVVVVGSLTTVSLALSLGWIYKRNQEAYRRDREINKKHEKDTFQTEVEHQEVNAKNQIRQGRERANGHDPEGALADLREAVRILDDVPKLGKEFTKWNPVEENSAFLAARKPAIEAVYRDAFYEMGNAQVMRESGEAFDSALEAYNKALEHDATSKDANEVRLAIGKVWAKKGSYDKAIEVYSKLLEGDPKFTKARLERGSVHDLAGRHDKAIEDYNDVIKTSSDTLDAHIRRGASYFALGQLEDAEKDFDDALAQKEDDWRAYIWRGRVHAARGHWNEATEDLNEAIDLNPSIPDAFYYRAEVAFAQRHHSDAIKDYETAITRSQTFYQAYLGLARALEWSLEYDRAMQHLDDVIKQEDREAEPWKPLAHALKGDLLQVRADPLESMLEVENEYREKHPLANGAFGLPPKLDELKTKAKDLREDRLRNAGESYDKAIELATSGTAPDRKDAALLRVIPALLGRARLSITKGDVQRARADLEAARAALDSRPATRKSDDAEKIADPDSAEVESQLGRVALLEKNTAQAEELLAAARKLEKPSDTAGDRPPDEGAFFYDAGLKQVQNAERSLKPEFYVQARNSFARSLARNPWHALARLDRAKVAVTWRAWDLALEDVSAAIEADPLLREAWELRGFLLSRDLPTKQDDLGRPIALRDPAKGEADLTRALELAGDQEKGLLGLTARYGRSLSRLAQSETNAAKLKEADDDVKAAAASIPQDLAAWVGARKPETPQDRIRTARAVFELDAKIAEKLGDKDRAAKSRERLDALIKQCQIESEKMIEDGRTLRDRRSYSEAIGRFDRAIDLDPDYSGIREKPGRPAEPAVAYYDRGTCYLKIGNFVPGILDFSHALEINPRWADQFYNKVYQVSYVVDLNRVITELNRVVSDHPDISYVVFLRGFFYVAKTEFKQFEKSDLDFGIKDFEKTLELNPKHATAWIYRGFLFYKKTQPQGAGKPAIADKDKPDDRKAAFDEALRDYDKAIENDARSGIARFLKSMCWSTMSMEDGLTPEEKQSRKEKAVDELEAAMDREFKGYDRIKAEKCFEAIRDNPRFVKLMGNK